MSSSSSSPQSSLDFGHKDQDLALNSLISEKTFSLPPPIKPASDSTIYRRRRKQVLIVIACTVLTFTGCGFNFAFGVYQEHYETLGGPFKNTTPGEIDLIGTLAASLMTIGAPFASSWTKPYSPRLATTLGAILFAVAGISASFGTRLWHFQLTQGLLQGCAACLAYIPAVTVSPGFFNARRGLAMGIILSGTGLGGMAWAPVLRYLITAIGFRMTLAVTGVLAAIIIAISASVLENPDDSVTGEPFIRHSHGRARWKSILPKVNWRLVCSKAFVAHASGGALHSAAYFIPVYFMSSFARTLGYSNTSGAHIIALSNFCNFGGKIIIGYLADRFGRLNALVLSTFVSAAATFALWFVSNIGMHIDTRRGLFLVYASIYGLTAGAYVSLFPTVLAEQFGIHDFASINGLLYMIRGLGTLIGTSIGAALVGNAKELSVAGFDRTFLFVGVCLSGATIAVAWARSMKTWE
jgi:MFS family permease